MCIAVVIVNFRTPELALACLRSVARERAALTDLRAVLVDNCSGDKSAQAFRSALRRPEFSGWVELLELPTNGGFGWANNQAMLRLLQGRCPPDFIHLLNPDASLHPEAIQELLATMISHTDAGAVGSQLMNADGSLSGSAFRFPSLGREWVRGHGFGRLGRLFGIRPTLIPYGESGPVDWVTGASVLLRSEALRRVGLFDTGFFLYFEEVELMYRLRKGGWKIYHAPNSRVSHMAGASTGVINGRSTVGSAPPDYILNSRRRFFALTSGRFAAALAGVCWLGGSLLSGLVRRCLGVTQQLNNNTEERRSLLRLGLIATGPDATPAIATWESPLNERPFWMSR